MTTDTADLPAPVAPRLRRPGWRDPRLLVGLALVAASVALGSWVVRDAQRTVPVLVARDALVPGAPVAADRLAVVQVRLGAAALDRYLPADEPLPERAVALRVVDAGELVPRSALGSADELALRPVSVPSDGRLPASLRAGTLVDLWHTPPDEAPAQLAAALTVAEVGRAEGALAAGGSTAVHVLVPVVDLPDVLAALAADGRVDVVPVPGS